MNKYKLENMRLWVSRILIMAVTATMLNWPVAVQAAEEVGDVSSNKISCNGLSANELSCSNAGAAADISAPEAEEMPGNADEPAAAGDAGQLITSVVLTQIMADGSDGLTYTVGEAEIAGAPLCRNEPCRYVTHDFNRKCIGVRVTVNVPEDIKDSTYYIFDRWGYSYPGHDTGRIKSNTFVCRSYDDWKLTVINTADPSAEKQFSLMVGIYDIDYCLPVFDSVTYTPGGKIVKGKSGFGYIDVVAHDDATGIMHSGGYGLNWRWSDSSRMEVRKNGKYSVQVRDSADHRIFTNIDVENIDSTPPDAVLTENSQDSVNGFVKAGKLEVTASDDTELDSSPFCYMNGSWTDKNEMTVSDNGTYKVKIRDVFGNETQKTCMIKDIDNTAPVIKALTCSMNVSENGFSKNAELSAEISDNGAGLADEPYSFDGGKTWQSDRILHVSANTVAAFAARDIFGNKSEIKYLPVDCIDREAPSIRNVSVKPQIVAGKYCARARVSFEAEDMQSGLSENCASFDGGKTWRDASVYTVAKNGSYLIRVRDRLGNTAETAFDVDGIDTTAPECTVTGNPAELTIGKAVLKIDAADYEAGLKSISVMNRGAGIRREIKTFAASDDGRGPENGEAEIGITANGEYIFFITDMCGNELKVSEKVTKLVKPDSDEKKEEVEPEKKKEDTDTADNKEKKTVIISDGQGTSANWSMPSGKNAGRTIVLNGTGGKIQDYSISGTSGNCTGYVSGKINDPDIEEYSEDGTSPDPEDEEIPKEEFFLDSADDDSLTADTDEHVMKENAAAGKTAAEQQLDERKPGAAKDTHAVPILVTVIVLMLFLAMFAAFVMYRKGIIGDAGGNDDE